MFFCPCALTRHSPYVIAWQLWQTSDVTGSAIFDLSGWSSFAAPWHDSQLMPSCENVPVLRSSLLTWQTRHSHFLPSFVHSFRKTSFIVCAWGEACHSFVSASWQSTQRSDSLFSSARATITAASKIRMMCLRSDIRWGFLFLRLGRWRFFANEPRRIHRVFPRIENDPVETPDHNRERCQQRFVVVDYLCHVVPNLRPPAQHGVRKYQHHA